VELCRAASEAADVLRLRINGEFRNDLIERRARETSFAVVIPTENVFSFPAGIYRAVHDGYFALIPPLPLGTHTVRVQGASTADGFEFDTRYTLNIVVPDATVPID
jgi:hypothetical protein